MQIIRSSQAMTKTCWIMQGPWLAGCRAGTKTQDGLTAALQLEGSVRGTGERERLLGFAGPDSRQMWGAGLGYMVHGGGPG